MSSDEAIAKGRAIALAEIDSVCTPLDVLMETDFPEPAWAVPGLIPEGLTILAGAPKVGKSWLALALCEAVATGGVFLGRYKCEKRNVLYLALEDSPRRLKSRAEKLGLSPAPGLTLARAWRPMRENVGEIDGLSLLELRAEVDEKTGLIVIDTFQKIRPPCGDRDAYESDYKVIGRLKALADEKHIAVVLVHHTRKMQAEDFTDGVLGSRAITGAADTIIALSRKRCADQALLSITGRDVEEREAVLQINMETMRFFETDLDPYASEITPERYAVLAELTDVPKKSGEIAKELGKSPSTISEHLKDLEAAGLASSPKYGLWTRKPAETAESPKVQPMQHVEAESAFGDSALSGPSTLKIESLDMPFPKHKRKSGEAVGASWEMVEG